MATFLPEPTAATVQALHLKLTKDWSEAHGVAQEISDIIHQRNDIETLDPNDARDIEPLVIHSGRAGGIIEHANGLLMAMPSFHMEPSELTTEAGLESDQVEHACAKIFEQQLMRNDFWPRVGRDLLGVGYAFLKALPLPNVWTIQAGYPVRKENEGSATYMKRIRKWKEDEGKFPFVIQHIPAMDVLALLDNSDKCIASIEVKKVMAKILAEDMNSAVVQELISQNAINWFDELSVVEYTDTEYVGYFLVSTSPSDHNTEASSPVVFNDYRKLRVWKHGLGRCPVVMIPGMKTELSNYAEKFKSFLADAKDALVGYDFLISRLATMVWTYYMPSYVWTSSESAAAYEGRDRPKLRVNLGGVTSKFADEDLQPLPMPQQFFDAERLITELDDIIQRHTLEDVLFGRVQGSAPAFQVNLRINVARSKLTPISQHMAMGAVDVMDCFLRGVEQLGEEVMIDGVSITPAQAKVARGRISASIEPKSPVDRAQDLGTAKMAKELGLPDVWWMENLVDIEDPATLKLQKEIEELENLPVVKERFMKEALQRLDVLIDEDEYQEIANLDPNTVSPAALQALQAMAGVQPGMAPPAGMEGEGLGRGPFPEGGAPQTLAPRGLLTPKEQPQPGTPLAESE